MFSENCMSESFVREIHKKYLELKSLQMTAEWLFDDHGIDLNRHKLSRLFRSRALWVNDPNGRPQPHYRDTRSYMDEYNELAADMVELAWDDYRSYMRGDGTKIDWMSACWYLSSEFYQSCLDRLNQNVTTGKFDANMMPPGVKVEDIVLGRGLYEDGYKFWVLHE
jgi:hypothetical protein